MICPNCGAEYRFGTGHCDACGVDAMEPSTSPEGSVPLVPLVSTSDLGYLPVVKSLLDSVGIPYFVQGEEAFRLWPVGPLMGGLSAGGALRATIHVPEDRLEEARALLEERAQSLEDES